MQYTSRVLKKNDFSTVLIVIILLHVYGIYKTDFNILNIFIECGTLIITLCLYFFKTFRRDVTEKTLNWLLGVVGLINSLSFAVLFSLSFDVQFSQKIVVFGFAFIVWITIILIMKLLYNCTVKMAKQKKDVVVPTSLITLSSLFGSIIGVYLFRHNILNSVERYDLFFGLASFLFSYFSLFIFKYWETT